jgi:hypothetical protein
MWSYLVNHDRPQCVIVGRRVDAIANDFLEKDAIDPVLLEEPDGPPFLEQLIKLLGRRQKHLVILNRRHVIPGKSPLRANGDTLCTSIAQLIFDTRDVIDERYAVVVADLYTQTTSYALFFIDDDHVAILLVCATVPDRRDRLRSSFLLMIPSPTLTWHPNGGAQPRLDLVPDHLFQ